MARLTVDDGICPIKLAWKVAISVSSAIQMKVDRVEVQLKGPKSSMGKVELGASVQMWTPGPSENVSAYFDGREINCLRSVVFPARRLPTRTSICLRSRVVLSLSR
jgi:hypothetical protein